MKKQHIVWIVKTVIILTIVIIFTYQYLKIIKPLREETVPGVKQQEVSLYRALRLYHKNFKKYPEGSSSDICQALSGKNSANIIFVDFPDKCFTPTGDILDQWGKPFDIKIENETITIRSAGPDGIFGNKDDSVIKSFYERRVQKQVSPQ